jgi:hypothetical protein
MINLSAAVAGVALLVASHASSSPLDAADKLIKLSHPRKGLSGNPKDREAVVHLKGMVENRVIGPLKVVGPYRIVETSKDLVLRNLKIQGITGLNLQRDGIRVRGMVDGVTIQNFRLEMRREPQVSPNLPTGIAVSSGQNIRISDGQVSGFQMVKVPGKYTNGDGIASERKVHGLSIVRVVSKNNSDGGFDLKSSPTTLDQLRAENNGRNYRFWSRVEAGTLTSIEPRGAHIWAGNTAMVHIKRLVARSSTSAPLVAVEGAGQVIIDQCELHLPRGMTLIKKSGQGKVVLGRGCSLPE